MRRAWPLLLLCACGPGDDAPSATVAEPTEPATSATEPEPQTPWFADVTHASGLRFTHDWGATPERHLPETMGAGAALFDADEDGRLDLYLLQGGRFPPFVEGLRPPNALYLNRAAPGEGPRFVDATSTSGAAADAGYGMGVALGDADGDGHADLFVTNFGPDLLLLGDGRGGFTGATARAGIADPRWTAGAAFFDADGDGDQDLYVTAYLEVDVEHPQWCGRREEGWRSYCHPDHYPGLADRYWENQGDGTFVDRTERAGLSDNRGKGLGVLAWDVDGDRDLDLYVANDSTENRLWRNDGRGRFTDDTLLSGTGVNAGGMTEAGMGIAVGDVDEDGRPDLLVTNFDDESNTLYLNAGATFRDATLRSGLEAPSRLPVGFGTVLADLDHDGHLDLVVANGHIIHNIELYHDGKTHAQELQLFRGRGDGTFEAVPPAEAGAPFEERYVGRGLYAGDLDGDGDQDLVLTQCGRPARVLENLAPPGTGLVVRGLEVGARVRLVRGEEQRVAIYGGVAPSYFGACAPELHLAVPPGAPWCVEVLRPGGELAGTWSTQDGPLLELRRAEDGTYAEVKR